MKPLIQPNVGEKVQTSVKEREQAGHSAETYDCLPSGEASNRRKRQSDHNESQSPDAGLIGDVGDRVCAELVGKSPVKQEGDRR